MTLAAIDEAITAVDAALGPTLGDGFHATIVLDDDAAAGSQATPVPATLLIVLAEAHLLHQARPSLRPIWPLLVESLQRPPIVGGRAAIERHLRLYPTLAEALGRRGRIVAGSFDFAAAAEIGARDRLAWDLGQALRASAALAPSILSRREADDALALLRRLSHRLLGQQAAAGISAADLFADLQAHLTARVLALGDAAQSRDELPHPPPVLGDLGAIYETESRVVLVLDDLSPEDTARRIRSSDWSDVAARIAGEYHGLQVTTARQFPLILLRERAADLVLQRYRLAWGLDLLAGLGPEPDCVIRDLGRQPSTLELVAFPERYIQSADEELPDLVHDFQNRLLNIQLREELFARLTGAPAGSPDGSLPARDAAPAERAAGILDHLGWWADYYAARLGGA